VPPTHRQPASYSSSSGGNGVSVRPTRCAQASMSAMRQMGPRRIWAIGAGKSSRSVRVRARWRLTPSISASSVRPASRMSSATRRPYQSDKLSIDTLSYDTYSCHMTTIACHRLGVSHGGPINGRKASAACICEQAELR
jgi:hypothetical protein